MRRFGIHGGIPRRSVPEGTVTTRATVDETNGSPPARRSPRRRTGRLLAGLGLVTAVLLTVSTTAGAAPPPPPNPSDAEIDRAGAAVAANVDRVGELIVRIADADQRLSELDAQVAIKREDVNRALVDLQAARDAVDAAERFVADTRRALEDAAAHIAFAQKDFDAFVRNSYMRGSNSASLAAFLDVDGPDDLLDRAQVMRLLSTGRAAVLDALQRARTVEANSNSRARAAKLEADAAAQAAEQRKAEAEAAIITAREALEKQAAEKARIEQERVTAQAALDEARSTVTGLEGQRAQYLDWERRKAAEEAAEAAAAEAARAAAAEAAARVAADEAARARAEELANGRRPHTQIEDTPRNSESAPGTSSGGTTTDPDLSGSGSVPDDTDPGTGLGGTEYDTDYGSGDPDYSSDDDTDYGSGDDSGYDDPDYGTDDGTEDSDDSGSGSDTDNPDPSDPVHEDGPSGTGSQPSNSGSTPRTGARPTVTGAAAIEIVIDRAMSQIGVPYAWGGGNENGPTRGIRDGGVADVHGDYNKIGFDCSGLMVYAFAGIGISLPHYTGYQYTAGTQIPSAQMRRGDMIFYGPNASQHVALYLGNGQMLEAPQSGSFVKISPVRWDGMTPYVVRMVS